MSNVSRFFYDFEFLDNGERIIPISLGMVNEDESDSLYVEFAANLTEGTDNWVKIKGNQWLVDNVLPYLEPEYRKSNHTIRSNLLDFVDKNSRPETNAEFWAYYGDYDHVALAQIFGTMMQLPAGFPMYTMDIKQLAVMKGNPQLPKQEYGEHNALADARHNLQMFKFLTENNIPMQDEWV